MNINDIVNISVVDGTRTASAATFNKALLIVTVTTAEATTAGLSETTRTKWYATAAAAAADFPADCRLEEMATALLSQSNPPSGFYAGVCLSDGTETGDYSEALDDILTQNTDFYYVLADTRTEADVKDIQDWAELNKKIYGTATSDTDAYTPGSTTDVSHYPYEQGYEYSFVVFDPTADASATDEYQDCAIVGSLMYKTAGSFTWKFKTATGVTSPSLTPAQENELTADDNNCNFFATVNNLKMFFNGTVALGGGSGYIDIVSGRDRFTARIQERILSLFARVDKISYTEDDLAAIYAEIDAQCVEERDVNNFLSDYSIEMPVVANISSADKAARELNDIIINATYAGAVHSAGLTIYVTL